MIAHVDADAFFAAVLMRKDPSLRGKPLLALGMGGGCVISASYEAKAKGVKTGMPLSEALKLCPDALHMNSDFHETGLASEQIEQVLREQAMIVEQMSVDEWFVDIQSLVGGEPHDLQGWATRLCHQIFERTGISVSAGVGPTKTLAKMASEYRKPAGVTVLEASTTPIMPPSLVTRLPPIIPIRTFLLDRPAAAIPGIGRRREVHAQAEGWKTAWDIAQADPERVRQLFGKPGVELRQEIRGEPVYGLVSEPAPPKSLSRCRSFRRTDDARFLWAHLLRHAQYLVLKLRRHGLAANGISVWVRDSEYRHESVHASLPQPTTTEEALQPYLRRCLRRLYRSRGMYTQVGLALWKLAPKGPIQFSLFDETTRLCRGEDLQRALDTIHKRFGRNALTRGASLAVQSGTKKQLEFSTY